jgi:UDP-N-acetylmuramate dehydrogenase
MVVKSVDFSKFSSIRVGGKLDVFEIEFADEVLQIGDFYIIGAGNNLLISPEYKGTLLKLSKKFDFINFSFPKISIGGATLNGKIFNFSKKENLSGFEFLQYLPSSLGGLVKMNAGLKEYETFENLLRVKTENGWIPKSNIEFGYRFAKIDGVILEAEFEIGKGFSKELVEMFQNMRANQPKGKSAGSTFKNPKGFSAGKLLQDVGMKGFKIGDMEFSRIHSNFLMNLGKGTFEDALQLIETAEKRVFEEFGIELQREIEVLM